MTLLKLQFRITFAEENLRIRQAGTIGAVASAAPFAIGYGGKLFVAKPVSETKIITEEVKKRLKNKIFTI